MIPTPYRYRNLVGSLEHFCIHEGYSPRLENRVWADKDLKDEFQKEVYEYARTLIDRDGLHGICDVGCGNGWKLVHMFADQCTLGLDLPHMMEWLREAYPARDWRAVNLACDAITGYDVFISADVIEHLEDPNELMRFLQRSKAKRIIISTPERDLLNHGTWNGPPKNVHHVREWNFAELHAYISSWLNIREHFIVEVTQIIDASPVG